jgi:hypothetical protein
MLRGGLVVRGRARDTVVVVFLSVVVLAVPASAFAAGSISGDVTDASAHGPIPGVRICAVEEEDYGSFKEFCTHSGLDGHYSISSLPAGQYVVEFLPGIEGLNYVYQAWEGKLVPFLADRVQVSSGNVPGIDAELVEGGRISGTVVNAGNGAPLPNVEVCAEPGGLNVTGCATTNALGEYTIVGLGTDAGYLVQFLPPEDTEFLEQYFDHEPGILGAEDVEVIAGSLTPDIDAELQETGQIAGTVTDALTRAPLAGVDACAWEATGNEYLGPCGESDASGHYKIRRVPPGAYHVSFNQFGHAPGYAIQWYKCSNGREATPVNVAAGIATSGIDAGLVERFTSPCESTSTPPAPAPEKLKKAPLRCRKGFHRKRRRGRVRCVKKRHHHRHRHHVRPGIEKH